MKLILFLLGVLAGVVLLYLFLATILRGLMLFVWAKRFKNSERYKCYKRLEHCVDQLEHARNQSETELWLDQAHAAKRDLDGHFYQRFQWMP